MAKRKSQLKGVSDLSNMARHIIRCRIKQYTEEPSSTMQAVLRGTLKLFGVTSIDDVIADIDKDISLQRKVLQFRQKL